MRLSTKARYGLRAMIYLALHQKESPIQLAEIAEREGVSEKYLEHLVRHLKAGGLVVSTRGAKGGYQITREPDQVTLYEIVTALEGDISLVDCLKDSELCDRTSFCAARDVWNELTEVMKDFLKSKTLADLAQRQKEKSNAPVYFI